jgi:hypothetical protein
MPDLFLHVPKTGGMTTLTALKWVYGPRWVYPLPKEDDRLDPWFEQNAPGQIPSGAVLAGHVTYGVHRRFERPCRYLTLLRHPLRRFVSHYYHRALFPESRLGRMSLREFAESDAPIATANRQTRFLSGREPDTAPQEALAAAKAHLRRDHVAFGVTERFDDSLLYFQQRLDWSRPPFYVRRKVNPDRPPLEALPDNTLALLRRRHRLDRALYRWARPRFEEAARTTIPRLAAKRRRFRRWNRLVQTVAPPLLWLYRTGRALLPSGTR